MLYTLSDDNGIQLQHSILDPIIAVSVSWHERMRRMASQMKEMNQRIHACEFLFSKVLNGKWKTILTPSLM